MARISIVGATGYAGTALVAEAARRGHQVTAYSRTPPEQRLDGVTYISLDVLEDGAPERAVTDADVVLDTLSPRGALEGELERVHLELATRADAAGVRFGVLGGAGSSLVAEGGPRVMDGPGFPAFALPEANVAATTLDELRQTPESLDWFMISPAASFGAHNPGETHGEYRTGGDVLVVAADGTSSLSAGDLAIAFVDEVERPAHRRQRFTVGY